MICTWLEAHGTTCLELAGFTFGVINVWLAARENVLIWPTGIANASMYSDTGLQVVYLLVSVYGWYAWLRGGPKHSALRITRTPRSIATALVIGALVMWALLWAITSRIPGAALAPLDAALVVSSLAAMIMMTRKYLECWIVWIIVDIVYVGMFAYKGLMLTSFLYAIFIWLAWQGHRGWTRSYAQA